MSVKEGFPVWSRKALIGACVAGALLLGACTGRGASPAPPAGDPGSSGGTKAAAPPTPAPPPPVGDKPAPDPAPAPPAGPGQPAAPPAGTVRVPPAPALTGVAAQPLAEGCGGAAADQGPAAPPAMVVAPGWGRQGNMPFPVRTARRSGCKYAVGGSSLAVDVRLPAGTAAAAARAALQISGAEPVYTNFFADGPRLSVGFPSGPNGQEIQIRVSGPLGAGGAPLDFRLDLVRDFPSLTVAVRQPPGEWRPFSDVDTLPPAPTELRFRWDRQVDHMEAELRVRRARGTERVDPQPAFAWADPQTLVATLARPPALAMIDMGGVPGPGAIATYARPIVVRTGIPPVLEALDPFTGVRTPLGPAPPDVRQVLAAPAGNHVAFGAFAPQPDGTWWLQTGWVLDLQEKRLLPAPFGSFLGWTNQGALAGVGEQGGLEVWHPGTGDRRRFATAPGASYASPSPDGRRIAGTRIQSEREDRATFLAPADLLVLDLETGQEQVYPDFGHYYVTHSEFGVAFPTIWTDGGRSVAGRDYKGRTVYQWAAVDTKSGNRRLLTSDEAAGLAAPDRDLSGPSGWRLEQERPWDTVYLVAPDGSRQDQGTGLPAGWLPDGRALVVRWEQSHLRYQANGS